MLLDLLFLSTYRREFPFPENASLWLGFPLIIVKRKGDAEGRFCLVVKNLNASCAYLSGFAAMHCNTLFQLIICSSICHLAIPFFDLLYYTVYTMLKCHPQNACWYAHWNRNRIVYVLQCAGHVRLLYQLAFDIFNPKTSQDRNITSLSSSSVSLSSGPADYHPLPMAPYGSPCWNAAAF